MASAPQTCPSCGLRNSSLRRRCARCNRPLAADQTDPDLRPPTFSLGDADEATQVTQQGGAPRPAGSAWGAPPRALTADLTRAIDPGTSAPPAAWQQRPAAKLRRSVAAAPQPPAARPPAAPPNPLPIARQAPPPLWATAAPTLPVGGGLTPPEAAAWRPPVPLWRLAVAGCFDLAMAGGGAALAVFGEARSRGIAWGASRLGLLEQAALWVHHHRAVALHGALLFVALTLLQSTVGTRTGFTPGRLLMRLRLVDLRHPDPSLGRALGRSLSCLLSALPFFAGFYWAVLDAHHCCWHDRLWGTRVVDEAA